MHKSFVKWQLSRYEHMHEAEKRKREIFANMNPLDGTYHRLYNVDIPRHSRIIDGHEVAWDYNRRVWVLFYGRYNELSNYKFNNFPNNRRPQNVRWDYAEKRWINDNNSKEE